MFTYKEFLKLLIERYKPFQYEIDYSNPLYEVNKYQNWAVRQSRRFFHTYEKCLPYTKANASVLDVGSFPGSYLKILQLLYQSDINLIATGMPVVAGFPADLKQLGIQFIPCDLDDALPTPYPTTIDLLDNSIDVLICTEMIEHMYTVKRLLTEMYRVLKPGGIAYISTNNVAYLPGIYSLLRGGTNLDDDLNLTSALCETEWRGHVRFYSLAQLASLASLFKFSVLEKGYYQMRAPSMIVKRSQLVRWYVSRFLDVALNLTPRYSSHIFVLLQKPH